MLPLVTVLLKLISFKTLAVWFGSKNPVETAATGPEMIGQSQLDDIERGYRLGYKYSVIKGVCLARSIVLMGLLRRYGINSEVVIGVQKRGGKFGAHAWLKLESGSYGPDSFNHQDFVPFS